MHKGHYTSHWPSETLGYTSNWFKCKNAIPHNGNTDVDLQVCPIPNTKSIISNYSKRRTRIDKIIPLKLVTLKNQNILPQIAFHLLSMHQIGLSAKKWPCIAVTIWNNWSYVKWVWVQARSPPLCNQGWAARQIACELQTWWKFIQVYSSSKNTEFLVFLFQFLHNWF